MSIVIKIMYSYSDMSRILCFFLAVLCKVINCVIFCLSSLFEMCCKYIYLLVFFVTLNTLSNLFLSNLLIGFLLEGLVDYIFFEYSVQVFCCITVDMPSTRWYLSLCELCILYGIIVTSSLGKNYATRRLSEFN